ncbi:unnamed protein product [Ixodes hexagonus]
MFLKTEVATRSGLVDITDEVYHTARGGVGGCVYKSLLPTSRYDLATLQEQRDMTSKDARTVLSFLLDHQASALSLCPARMHATALVTLAKRGSVTDQRLQKISDQRRVATNARLGCRTDDRGNQACPQRNWLRDTC